MQKVSANSRSMHSWGGEIRHDAAVKAAQHFVARLAAEFLVQLARAGWKPYGEGLAACGLLSQHYTVFF